MKLRIIAFLLVLVGTLSAESVSFLRKAFIYCYKVNQPNVIDYRAWAGSFQRANDLQMVNLIAEIQAEELFAAKSPRLQSLNACLKHYPQSDALLNMTAWTRYLLDDDTEAAYQLIQRVKNHTPASIDTLAMIQSRRGHHADALQIFLTLLPEISSKLINSKDITDSLNAITLFDHAGTIFYKNQHYVEAARLWAEAYRITQTIIEQGKVSSDILLVINYDPIQARKKIRALQLKVKQMRAVKET